MGKKLSAKLRFASAPLMGSEKLKALPRSYLLLIYKIGKSVLETWFSRCPSVDTQRKQIPALIPYKSGQTAL